MQITYQATVAFTEGIGEGMIRENVVTHFLGQALYTEIVK